MRHGEASDTQQLCPQRPAFLGAAAAKKHPTAAGCSAATASVVPYCHPPRPPRPRAARVTLQENDNRKTTTNPGLCRALLARYTRTRPGGRSSRGVGAAPSRDHPRGARGDARRAPLCGGAAVRALCGLCRRGAADGRGCCGGDAMGSPRFCPRGLARGGAGGQRCPSPAIRSGREASRGGERTRTQPRSSPPGAPHPGGGPRPRTGCHRAGGTPPGRGRRDTASTETCPETGSIGGATPTPPRGSRLSEGDKSRDALPPPPPFAPPRPVLCHVPPGPRLPCGAGRGQCPAEGVMGAARGAGGAGGSGGAAREDAPASAPARQRDGPGRRAVTRRAPPAARAGPDGRCSPGLRPARRGGAARRGSDGDTASAAAPRL